jgi:hypothetical protein
MASIVCDVTPCKDMVRLIDQLAISTVKDSFELMVIHARNGAMVRLRLIYCPFCGTYIDEKWVENYGLQKNGVHKSVG